MTLLSLMNMPLLVTAFWNQALPNFVMKDQKVTVHFHLIPRERAVLLRHLTLSCSMLVHNAANDSLDAGDFVQGFADWAEAGIFLLLAPPLKPADQGKVGRRPVPLHIHSLRSLFDGLKR